MIYGELKGVCGHQLCIYAIVRKLQLSLYPDDEICFNEYQVKQKDGNNNILQFTTAPFKTICCEKYSLCEFGSPLQKASNKAYSFFMRVSTHNDVSKRWTLQDRYQPTMNQLGIYTAMYGLSPLKGSSAKNKFLDGMYWDPKLFDDIRPALLEEIQPIEPIPDKNKSLYEVIENTESVCVTIRHEWFSNPQHIKNRGLCTLEYFQKAIDQMKTIHPNANFIFFSDEIDWIRENYHFDVPCFYEDGSDTVAEKLRMMYSCKHFIISNSSFSWWAQYLGRNSNKTVIAPKTWNARPHFRYTMKSDDWILIEV